MLQQILLKQLDREEKALGASLDYARYILRHHLGAFFRFALFMPLSRYRQHLPPAACHIARLVATQAQDCGTCVQIGVNLARQEGVATELIQATLAGRPQDLPKELAQVYTFAKVVAAAQEPDDGLREQLRNRYGDAGLVELALAIASCQVYPITKRALGYATSCTKVKIEY